MKVWVTLALVMIVTACGTKGPLLGSETEIAALAARIQRLSPEVDPAEATRAARMSYTATHHWRLPIRSPTPLIHNAKVNAGQRPRGLCYHWAEDMEARLDSAGFKTLETARAIANADNPILIDHSTTIIVPRARPCRQVS